MAKVGKGVEVTLLDLGCMTRVGGRPYGFNSRKDPERLKEKCNMYKHLAPEAVYGKQVTAASDVFSLGRLVERVVGTRDRVLCNLRARAAKSDPRDRPSLGEFREAFALFLKH